MTLVLSFGARSHVGRVRTNNEDSGYASCRVLAVADGVGGNTAGEVASALAMTAMQSLENDLDHGDLDSAMRALVLRANQAIHRAVEHNAALRGMATTLTAVRLLGCHIGLAHLGDTRAYLLRDGELSQITRDDTLVQDLVDSGRLTPAEALTSSTAVSHCPRPERHMGRADGVDSRLPPWRPLLAVHRRTD